MTVPWTTPKVLQGTREREPRHLMRTRCTQRHSKITSGTLVPTPQLEEGGH